MEINLERLLGLPESPPIANTPKKEQVLLSKEGSDQSNDIQSDYEFARQNLYDLIENGSSALEALVNIASVSESPRAFEVVSNLMKTLTDANKDLLEIQTKVKKLKQATNTDTDGTNVTNNSLFVGSTNELQRLINEMNNKQ